MLSVFQQFVGINVCAVLCSGDLQELGNNTDASLLQTIVVGIINSPLQWLPFSASTIRP
jgi:SP family xylose:H+ symportor-like MFS transporter